MENLPSVNYKTRQFDVELSREIRDDATEEAVDIATALLFQTAKRNVANQIQLAINTMTFPQQ